MIKSEFEVDQIKISKLDTLDKIMYGVELAYKRLVEKTKKEGGELVFADENGKIYFKKASEL